jgi:hypothetical protein
LPPPCVSDKKLGSTARTTAEWNEAWQGPITPVLRSKVRKRPQGPQGLSKKEGLVAHPE